MREYNILGRPDRGKCRGGIQKLSLRVMIRDVSVTIRGDLVCFGPLGVSQGER